MAVTHYEEDGKTLCGKDSGQKAVLYANCLDCRQVLLDRLPEGPWERWANQRENGNFCDIGHRLYCKAHGRDQEPVKVLIELDPDGLYYGWQDPEDDGEDRAPSMIWDRKNLFEMCFTYGVEPEVKAKKGRVVRLKITAVS
jgi:hypothetical protein